jgi:hypothetical protein
LATALSKSGHAHTLNLERSEGCTLTSGYLLPRVHLYGSCALPSRLALEVASDRRDQRRRDRFRHAIERRRVPAGRRLVTLRFECFEVDHDDSASRASRSSAARYRIKFAARGSRLPASHLAIAARVTRTSLATAS